MAEVTNSNDNHEEPVYTFRFGTSKRIIRLNQQQLERIPYLCSLVARQDDFLSIQNASGQYVLSSWIHYRCFKVILNAIITDKPSTLFTELPLCANVLTMLHLYDYLCLDPLPVPLLKDEHLARSTSTDSNTENKRISYRRASILEARNTAVQFIVALSNNTYKLDDINTIRRIFYLIKNIVSNPNVLTTRLCHHTLKVVKKYCFPFFSHEQQQRLLESYRYAETRLNNSPMNVYEDDQFVPLGFFSVFAWTVGYEARNEYDYTYPMLRLTWLPSLMDRPLRLSYRSMFNLHDYPKRDFTIEDTSRDHEPITITIPPSMAESSAFHSFFLDVPERISYSEETFETLLLQNRSDELSSINEAKFARLGHFNTLPKRPQVDRYKHRSGPKAQKYR